MQIEHLFNTFNSDNLIYRGAPEKPERAPAASERPEKNPEALERAAERHIQNAKSFLDRVIADISLRPDYKMEKGIKIHYEDSQHNYAQYFQRKTKGIEYLSSVINTVVKNIQYLEEAIEERTLSQDTLRVSRVEMEVAKKFHDPLRVKGVNALDPLGSPNAQVDLSEYSTRVQALPTIRTKSVRQATTDALHVAEKQERFTTRRGILSFDAEFEGRMTELAAARDSEREPSKNIHETAQELTDVMRLYQAARKGLYRKESPENLLKRQARLIDRVFRRTGATRLSAGGVLDLGYVMIQKSTKGEAYLLTVAEGGILNKKVAAIPSTILVDLGYEKKRSSLEKQLNSIRKEIERTAGKNPKAFDKLRTKETELEEAISKLKYASVDDFSSEAEDNANKIANRMIEDMNKKA